MWSWLVTSGESHPLFCGHTDTVTCAVISSSGKMLVTGSLDNTLKSWLFRTHSQVTSVKPDTHNWHQAGIECVDLYSQMSLSASGARDGSVRLTNLKTNEIVASYQHTSADENENCSVEAVAFNTKYNWIASASMNSKVIIYDFGTCRIRHELQHGGGVIRLVWHPNNIVLITGCLDGCVYLWDGRTGELLKQLNGHTDMLLDMSVVVDKNKTYISTVSDDKTCQVFRVEI